MATREGGRDLPGRLSFALPTWWPAAAEAGALAAAAVVTRLPLRTRHLLNWDADQFALGMRHFDVVHHQPHPPGYLGYVALGRVLALFSGDANSALVALSIAGEAGAVAVAFLLALRLFGAFAGRVTAVALLVSPLFWYYGEAADTYGLEPLLVLAVAGLGWRVWNGDRSAAPWLAITLAGAGAIRPSTEVLLGPLAALSVLRLRDPRTIALSAGTACAGTLGWLLPLLALAGGVGPYVHASTVLGSDVTADTAIWEAGLGGLATTSDAVMRGMVWELGGFAVAALFGLVAAPRLRPGCLSLPPGWSLFSAAWAAPALLVFLFVHIGQVAYVQVFTPALFLVIGPAVLATARVLRRPRYATAIAALCAAASLAIFALPPRVSLAGQLARHDTWVDEMTSTVRRFDPDRTLLVADAYAVGSYRTAQVYLPEYHRAGLARDRHGRAGEIFGDVYAPEGFDAARPLDVPPGTETYVIVDRSVVDELVADPERLRVVRFPDGARIYVWTGPPPAVHDGRLWFGPVPRERRGLEP